MLRELEKRFGIIIKTFRIIWVSSPGWTVLRFLLSIISQVLPLLTIFLFKEIIDLIELSGDGFELSRLKELYPILGLWISILLINGLISLLINYVTAVHDFKVSLELQGRLHKKAREIPYAYFDTPKYYDVFHRAQRESSTKPKKLIEDLSTLLGHAFVILGVLGILASLSYWIPLLLISIGFPAIWSRRKYAKALYDHSIRTTASERMSVHLSKVLTQQPYASEMRVFDKHASIHSFFEYLQTELFLGKLKEIKAFIKRGSISTVLETVIFVGFIVFALIQLLGGIITIGSFVMYFQAFQKGQVSFKTLFSRLVSIFESRLFLGTIFQFLELPSISRPENTELSGNAKIETLEMKDIHFQYPEEDKEVLKSVDFSVQSGELIGIVGENGSGKSTLMKLISGLYIAQKGEFLVNGMPISQLGLENYRNEVSTVSQEYSKYLVNAGFNITFEKNSWDEGKMSNSIKLSDLSKVIDGFPDGLNTPMSRAFADGKELSGGQWQKFALARAIYKEASVMVLDEPTSHIDGATTTDFFHNIKSISQNKIIFVVTHQMANLTHCDKIWVMKDGKFAEKGDLNWMLENSRYFSKMFASQIMRSTGSK